ncbi:RNA-binding S4 domain-containing protein [Desulfobacter sp.]
MTENRIVYITQAPVELYKVLKFENFASSGGEAKHMLADGLVRVNGRVETRKRKKILPGDLIEIYGTCLEIQMDSI